MTEKLDKYLLDIEIDNETGEEHCTVLKTDGTTDMNNWITIINAMYTHHSVFEPLIKELNKLSEENEELKEDYDYLEKRFKEEEWHYEHIDEDRDVWMHKCHELEKENEQLKKEIESWKQHCITHGIAVPITWGDKND